MADMPEYIFDHVHLYCTDLPASERWFVEGMGAEPVRRRDSGGIAVSELRMGGTTVLLRGARQGEALSDPQPSGFGTNHFGLRVKDLDGAVAALKARGVQFEGEPWVSRPGTRVAFAAGPDNVRVELLQRDPAPLG